MQHPEHLLPMHAKCCTHVSVWHQAFRGDAFETHTEEQSGFIGRGGGRAHQFIEENDSSRLDEGGEDCESIPAARVEITVDVEVGNGLVAPCVLGLLLEEHRQALREQALHQLHVLVHLCHSSTMVVQFEVQIEALA